MHIGDFVGDADELKWNFKDLHSNLVPIVEKHVPAGRRNIVVQAGGCFGVFAAWLSLKFHAVYCFEPEARLFGQMVYNVHKNGKPYRCVLMQAALGAEPMLVNMKVTPTPGKINVHAGMAMTSVGGIVPTLRVDDLNLRGLDLLYLDVEGDELTAIFGAEQTIMRYTPAAVVCEINRAAEMRGVRREDIVARMRLLGYESAGTYRSDEAFVPRG